ncbi:MAG: SulP family inorganic anion transporter [Arcobacter sp.]|uniref:Sulfate permease n=1 Tax=Arcobacter defluvii TaxID=873191 RepID=A0AAE7E667_9BACT|nr:MULTISPECIES: SulP family inorganic anion transporter [Arcobacter]MDY3199930.1 SulP family inorganic anion transporter [Arcobacter sp.]QKF77570.1 sulfate permease [Arcobacter defluvii]RXI31721.1 SulP family inorganic anion transporter [Arcobacter defluvii]BAK73387.1 sulfate transport protein [Arcobacter sp. L]
MNRVKNDIFAGITAAVVALPLALAFGVASGAGAIAGLYGAIILGFFAALFGGTPTQISGPTGPMTVIVATAIATFPNDFQTVMTIVFLAGLMQISFGIVGIGKWIKYIPYPVISGFMCGIGVIIIILQINPFLGVEGYSSIVYTLTHLTDTLTKVNYEAILIATITLAIMFLTPKKISKIIPPALIALVLVTLFSIFFHFKVMIIGEIPMGLPQFVLPISFDILKLSTILTLAITLALLGSIDSLLTSIVADSKTKTKHDSKKELIGQGIGNTICSFFGAIPGAGATMRTVININSGATSKLSGMVHSVTLLLIVLFLAPLASQIPLAVLSGILIKVGFDILDYKFLKVINKVSKQDLIIMITVFLLTVFVDLIMAVGVGITISSIIAVYQISKNTQMKTAHSKVSFDIDIENHDIEIIKVNGSLFFGTASALDTRLEKIKNSKKIIIDCRNVSFLDISAIFTLEDIIEKFKSKDLEIILVLKYRHKKKVLAVDSLNVFKKIRIYHNLDDAINYTQKYELIYG